MKGDNNSGLLSALVIIVLTILSSCESGTIYSASEKINDNSWASHDKIVFQTVIDDTINACNIDLVLRTNSEYPYRNIFLFVSTSSPSGLSINDTLEYYLADMKGKWYGAGLGDIHDLSVRFRSNILFPETGEYSFIITQGMRQKELKGILDIGLNISHIK